MGPPCRHNPGHRGSNRRRSPQDYRPDRCKCDPDYHQGLFYPAESILEHVKAGADPAVMEALGKALGTIAAAMLTMNADGSVTSGTAV